METNMMKIDSIDTYIVQFPSDVQVKLHTLRQTIRDAAPDAKEKISYSMPTFTLHGNLVHFAAYQNHIGFYPAPSGIQAFAEQLSIYKGTKGSVQFPLDQPLPIALISEIVKFRVQESERIASSRLEQRKNERKKK
jgi:uncharacterized protein YdhG (YjbR/CyaY superfamily)